ncbi:MAG: YihY/virulence factor BrkB family protein [Gammaproteobacteria bacterium]|nr:YihY/virulence factor BrkB family protein [Gammaproteobacteria bacterium]
MLMSSSRLRFVMNNPLQFITRVFEGFRANQGFLLSGAIAYYTLLSIIPMIALILLMLSQFQEPQQLLAVLREYLVLVTPGQVDVVVNQIHVFLQDWKVIGVLGFGLLLFFSSFAFTALENAMSVIFFHRVNIKRRRFLVSAIIPYIYILLLAVGLLIVSVVSGFLHSLQTETLLLFGHHWSLNNMGAILIYMLGVTGEIILLTSLYLVMPVGRLSVRHALIGGVTAALLWELMRHFLVWYFSTLSLVNVIYGAFTTSIIILVSLEAASIILLLGAQVIAEYERIGNEHKRNHGLQSE